MGPHWDSRNKWLEGILSIGFGNEAGKDDPRGDTWNLILEKGTKGYDTHYETVIKCNPGTAYIIFGNAQGRTEKCNEGKVMHEACQCCWRHGINSDPSDKSVRLSMTLRTYDVDWGRRYKRHCKEKTKTGGSPLNNLMARSRGDIINTSKMPKTKKQRMNVRNNITPVNNLMVR